MNGITGQAIRFVRDFARYGRGRVAMAAALVGLGAAVEGLGVLLLVPLLAVVTGARDMPAGLAAFVTEGRSPLESLVLLLAAFGVVMALRSAIILARDVTMAQLQVGFVEAHRQIISRRLAQTNWATINALSHARLTHVMSADISRCGVAANFTLQCGVALVMLLAQVVLIFLLSPRLAGFSLGLLLFSGLLLAPFLMRAHANGKVLTAGQFALMRDTGQFLGGLKQAFSHNREQAYVQQAEGLLENLRVNQIDFVRQRAVMRIALSAMASMVGAATLLIGYAVMGLAPAVLVTVLVVLARMAAPLAQIQQGVIQLVNSLPAYDLVTTLEAELEAAAIAPPAEAGETPPPFAPIRFEQVSFIHAPDGDGRGGGLRSLDLVIAPGATLGVGGASGAGKTTFADLLAGLYPPRSGRVTVGGVALEGGSARSWRERIAYVPQDPFLMHASVRNNLQVADPDAPEPALWTALEIAGARALVESLPQGLDTVVGERGARLSGGERQRLALAGAVLREPELLILDESTSAVDVATEDGIIDRLRSAFPRATLVIIAHRAESMARCDRIITLDQGALADDRLLGPT